MDPNPFTALISPQNVTDDVKGNVQINQFNEKHLSINSALEYVFRIVVNDVNDARNGKCNENERTIKCVLLNDGEFQRELLSYENIDRFIFDRLMVNDLKEVNVKVKHNTEMGNDLFSTECEQKLLHYLYQCFYRIQMNSSKLIPSQQMILLKKAIIKQTSLFMCHPDFYPNFGDNSRSDSLLDLLDDYADDIDQKSVLQLFIDMVSDEIVRKHETGDEEMTLNDAIKKDYEILCQRFSRMSLIDSSLLRCLNLVLFFTSNVHMGKALITMNTPKGLSQFNLLSIENEYQKTMFGRILSISCLPRPNNSTFEFFLKPSQYMGQENEMTHKNLCICLDSLTRDTHKIIYALLKHKELKNSVLNWIEMCLHSFRDRSKIWPNEMLMMNGVGKNPSDGFMLNLSVILLNLSKPFCVPPSQKLLKVDARYCVSASDESSHKHNQYLKELRKESFLIPNDSIENPKEFEPNFMTQCFVATHKAFQLGFRVVSDRFTKLASDLNKIQRLYQEAHLQNGSDSEVSRNLQERMDNSMTPFLSMRAMLTNSTFLETALNFHVSTALWLNNLAVIESEDDASAKFAEIKLPLSKSFNSKYLCSVPEFIVENIADFVVFLRRFSDKSLIIPGIDLEPLMTLILIFMGSPQRMKNPHLRARMSEMLEALIPVKSNQIGAFSFGYSSLEKLFTNPSADELISTLIHVFVTIEISENTGEVMVSFEQKFQYRRPMYIVLKYLWDIESHRNKMKEIADYAENNMESIKPPLFLRFINLLMNDAVFLIDEGFEYMKKLRTIQQERDSGSWAQLPQEQQNQNEANFRHTGRLAYFHNIIGRDTITTLSWITEEIKTIFCQKQLVERIASMLNNVLRQLVGRDQKSFKVKDMDEYEFKPAIIVSDICKIYLNLASQENRKFKVFCLAIGRDERSYSQELFTRASDILTKTGFSYLSPQITNVGIMIEQLRKKHLRNQELSDEVPDEFLDGMLFSIMTEPVILPESGVRVDRSTIARHLLSNQTDPFTRSPLTMEMVIPDLELKQKITDFLKEKVKSKNTGN